MGEERIQLSALSVPVSSITTKLGTSKNVHLGFCGHGFATLSGWSLHSVYVVGMWWTEAGA